MTSLSYYVIGGLIAAFVVVAWVVVQRRGADGQSVDASLSALGATARVKSSVQPEMSGIKAGRDVRVIAGSGDPARMADVDAGRDVIRDTTEHGPKG